MKRKQIHLFETKDELLAAANEQADLVHAEELRLSTRLYFLARYFVAVFESRYGKIPIQVWNEYRNALDHYFRHITDSYEEGDTDRKSHMAKMEGHLQRAVLDVLKILCHATQDTITSEKSQHLDEVLRLVNSGEFIEKFNRDYNAAVERLSVAKISDLNLGNDAATDTEIVGLYLDAAFTFDELKRFLIDNAGKIERARGDFNQISSRAKKLGFWEEYGVHAFFYFTVFLFGILIKDPAISIFNKHFGDQEQELVQPAESIERKGIVGGAEESGESDGVTPTKPGAGQAAND